MTTRYTSSLLLALAGGFVVVASQAFTPATVAWLAFAVGALALVLAAGPALARSGGAAAYALDGVIAVLAAWTVVASLVFGGSLVTWLSLAEGLGFVGLAVAGLTLQYARLARAARAAGVLDVRTHEHHGNGQRTPVAA